MLLLSLLFIYLFLATVDGDLVLRDKEVDIANAVVKHSLASQVVLLEQRTRAYYVLAFSEHHLEHGNNLFSVQVMAPVKNNHVLKVGFGIWDLIRHLLLI